MHSMTFQNFTDKYKHQTTAHHAKAIDMNTNIKQRMMPKL
jgi:hypothetical protein